MSEGGAPPSYPDDTRPFLIERLDEDRAIVRFAEICDHERTSAHEKELLELVETHSHIACDLSRTIALSSEWIRWLYRLAVKAEPSGKLLALVGVSADLKESADVIALKDKFLYREQVEEVWAL